MLSFERRLWSASLIFVLLVGCGDADETVDTEAETGTAGRPDNGDRDQNDDGGMTADDTDATAEDTGSQADAGASTDTESTAPDVVTPDDVASGSPGDRALEPCGGSNGECAAGLDCLNTGSDGEGFCMLPCNGGACDDVRGEQAICALGVQGEPEPRYCVPLCDSDADCPTGISCKPVNETLSVCAP